jgi:response regulator RpfG family c-di-GMP phosphodiesterase
MSEDVVTFLLVDDLEENLLALEGLLRRDGLELLKARTGPQALELLLVHDVALAIIDVQMPGMDGFELAELMRGTARTRRIPIIFVTAGAVDMQRRFRGYEAGAVDFLFKPIEPRILQGKAEVFFELYRQRQEVARQRDQLRVAAEENARLLEESRRAAEALRELNVTLESRVAQRTVELEHRTHQLQKLALELSQAEDRERRRIAAILHEDLQQQIAGARFHLDLVRSRTRHDPSQQTVVARVDEMLREAIEKSRGLSHDLSPAVLHMNDPAEVLQWLAKQMHAKHGLTVGVEVPDETPLPSEALMMFLFRATQELLFNVVKHARVREARIRVRRRRQFVCLSVYDRGCGFDPRELKETAGFGLLSIRERAELLGGRMRIKSIPGQGSRFHLIVPAARPAAAPPPTEVRIIPEQATEAHPDGRLRVLLADDHEMVRQGLVSLLRERHEIEVVGEAANGQEAVALAHQLRPDVVIMDVSMPKVNGEQATRQIKEHLPEVRIVAISMHQEAETIGRMCQAGAESYVLKTAPPQELFAAIQGKSRQKAP